MHAHTRARTCAAGFGLKNVHCLRTVFNVAHRLADVLGSSWALLVDVLAALDRALPAVAPGGAAAGSGQVRRVRRGAVWRGVAWRGVRRVQECHHECTRVCGALAVGG
jgi:hypothetical protein